MKFKTYKSTGDSLSVISKDVEDLVQRSEPESTKTIDLCVIFNTEDKELALQKAIAFILDFVDQLLIENIVNGNLFVYPFPTKGLKRKFVTQCVYEDDVERGLVPYNFISGGRNANLLFYNKRNKAVMQIKPYLFYQRMLKKYFNDKNYKYFDKNELQRRFKQNSNTQ